MSKFHPIVRSRRAVLRSPSTEKEEPAAPGGEADHPAASPQLWGPFKLLLRLRAFEAIRYREFRLLWFGQASVSMGTWMDQVARGWLIYELTNSTVQLGLVRGVQAIPLFLLSPVAGSAVDHYDRKMLLLAAQVLDGLMYGAIALLIITGYIQPWHVYVTAIGMGMVQAFQHPARAAMVADTVPPTHLTNAIGLNSVVFNVSRSTGPALAGVLIAMFGTAGSYALQAVFYLLATVWTVPLRPPRQSSAASHRHAAKRFSLGRSIAQGWKFSWRNEVVRAALLIATSASFFIIPFTALLPVFARDLLGVGATGQGLLLTAMGVGALGSAFIVASLGDQAPRGIIMLGGVVLYGLSVIAFSASPWFNLSVVLMMFTGVFHVSSHALVQTVVQAYSPSELRGRTMAILQQVHFLLSVGSVVLGALAAVLGARWAMALMGATGALSMIIIYAAMPRARLIR